MNPSRGGDSGAWESWAAALPRPRRGNNVPGSRAVGGTDPAVAVRTRIAADIRRHGRESAFVRVRPGVFGLRRAHGSKAIETMARTSEDSGEGAPDNQTGLRVQVPYFPEYLAVRDILRVWAARPRNQVTNLRAAIIELQGTRKSAVDWTDPMAWIPDRLHGADRELAQAIWDQSNGTVNPRHVYGHWLLSQQCGGQWSRQRSSPGELARQHLRLAWHRSRLLTVRGWWICWLNTVLECASER